MSEYMNFIQDFPTRCGEILESYQKRATFQGREVTLMLSIASSGFLVPYERIRAKHPSGDASRYNKICTEIKSLFNTKFNDSSLLEDASGVWWFGKLASHNGMPDDWPEMRNLQQVSNKEKTREILYHLRNALAHGNIFTMGKKIEKIIFLSTKEQDSPQFYYLAVTPNDFSAFLTNWFKFLGDLQLPVGPIAGEIDDLEEYPLAA